MIFSAISDTHDLHDRIIFPKDINALIHCGDFCNKGNKYEVIDFLDWFSMCKAPHKILVPGNRDVWIESNFPKFRKECRLRGITPLLHESATIQGVKVFGSPYVPYIREGFAFQMSDENLRRCWQEIPGDTRLLITHTPPYGILDGDAHLGCKHLAARVEEVRPRYHIFGHIHEGHGMVTIGETTYVNTSVARQIGHFDFEPDVLEVRYESIAHV